MNLLRVSKVQHWPQYNTLLYSGNCIWKCGLCVHKKHWQMRFFTLVLWGNIHPGVPLFIYLHCMSIRNFMFFRQSIKVRYILVEKHDIFMTVSAVQRSYNSKHSTLPVLPMKTVRFPLGPLAHSRHALFERESYSSLFPLVILGLLSALSVLILQPALCRSAPFI